MLETYTVEDLRQLAGHEVVDAKGEKIGYIDLVFYDDESGQLEWLGIWDGLAGDKPRVLVPASGIEVVGNEVRLPWTKDVVMSAPSYGEEDHQGIFLDGEKTVHITPEKESAAYKHYGLQPRAAQPEVVEVLRMRVIRIQQG